MSVEVVEIGAFALEAVASGSRRRLALSVQPGLTGPVTLPALVARGRVAGPVLVTVAGIHGDEYEGMEAIRRVFGWLDPERLRGAFVGIPVANPFAYEARSRAAPATVDGLNLARVFPGDPAGTPSRVLAAALLDLVERTVSPDGLFVDLHSGSLDVAYATLVGFRDVANDARERAEEAARHFGVDRIWRIPDSLGPFNAETARRGIPTLGTETTGRAGFDSAGALAFEQGLFNLLAYLGMLTGAPRPTRTEGPARPTVDVHSPATGFFQIRKGLSEETAIGEELGVVVDVFGEPIAQIFAPESGTIWAARAMPAVRSGELVFTIALRSG